jgi:YfiH family protein
MKPFLIKPDLFKTFPELTIGCSTRHGGVSPAPYHSLNLGMNTGDKEGNILENRRLLLESVGFRADQMAVMHQIHGSEVKMVNHAGFYPDIDGMVTNTPDVMLCVGIADCAAILLADPIKRVIGACHSGWRGTAANIASETIEAMKILGAKPRQMMAFISPCIGMENFEVGHEVAAQFDPTFVHEIEGKAKPHIDLKGVIVQQLREAGIHLDGIEVSTQCTVADTETFFSFRAEAGRTGRMMGFIGMNSALRMT